jgi:hypothetical protein
MKEYENVNGDVPKMLKLVMMFIDRVGFPVMAFCLMYYFSVTAIDKVSIAVCKVNETQIEIIKLLTDWQSSTMEFRKSMLELTTLGNRVLTDNQKEIIAHLNRLQDKVKN